MILSLENSLAEHVRPKFKMIFGRTMAFVTGLYVVFGCSGYISFGPETREIITLNLPDSDGVIDFAMVVKCCLCFSLFFTYPLMVFPVVTIIEKRLPASYNTTFRGNALRLLLVLTSGLVVVLIPNFANLMAIIGGTCCTLLAFILPGLFHLKLRRRSISPREKYFDIFLICIGMLGAVIATSDAIFRMSQEAEVPAPPLEGLTPGVQVSWSAAPAANATAASHLPLSGPITASVATSPPNDTLLAANGTLLAANDTLAAAVNTTLAAAVNATLAAAVNATLAAADAAGGALLPAVS
ncbi:amino acid transporter AVT3B-like [Pollicipes pollicipes]|uniref:amino acid transporter AVT3B-like n=1 Tax=Pollicipes pollicipes TaxID=41117 RepID=UPI0018857B33|nr:amino acid transporter AVT3B-like [Pollicipes pollicipes]